MGMVRPEAVLGGLAASAPHSAPDPSLAQIPRPQIAAPTRESLLSGGKLLLEASARTF